MTGAAGNIGRHLRATLGASFERLLLLDITPIDDLAAHERYRQVDLRDLEAVSSAFAGVEGVIHLGGIADEADFHDLAEVNIVGMYHVLEGARTQSVRRVVYASSNRATGFYPTDHRVEAHEPFRPDGLYGASKAACEVLARLYVDKFQLQVACLRIGSFEQEPSTPRELHTWLSPRDCTAAFAAAVTGTYQHSTFYAVSANTNGWWDLEPGRLVGFHPQDDAQKFASRIAGAPIEPQGGRFATAEFTLSRQRHASQSGPGE